MEFFPKIIARLSGGEPEQPVAHAVEVTLPDGQKLDKIVKIHEDERGFRSFEEILFETEVTLEDPRGQNVERLREQMDKYFTAEIRVFDKAAPRDDLALVFWSAMSLSRARLTAAVVMTLLFLAAIGGHWLPDVSPIVAPVLVSVAAAFAVAVGATYFISLPGGFRDSGIWPGFLETRLMAFTVEKFEGVDADIRALIDALADLFLHNLQLFVTRKRHYQSVASWTVIGIGTVFWLAAVVVSGWGALSLQEISEGTSLQKISEGTAFASLSFVSAVLLTVVVAAAAIYGFNRYNFWLYEKHYLHALEASCKVVKFAIGERMRSLSQRIADYRTSLAELREKGEIIPANVQRDEDLREFRGFLLMRVILWLSKRSEYQELYLVDRMHEMRRQHFNADIGGYLGAFRIALRLGATVLIPLFCLTYFAFALKFWLSPFYLVTVVQGGLLLAVVFYLSYRSYNNQAWNPSVHVLEHALDSSQWETFKKLRIDATLAGQYQRALGMIAYMSELIKGGRKT